MDTSPRGLQAGWNLEDLDISQVPFTKRTVSKDYSVRIGRRGARSNLHKRSGYTRVSKRYAAADEELLGMMEESIEPLDKRGGFIRIHKQDIGVEPLDKRAGYTRVSNRDEGLGGPQDKRAGYTRVSKREEGDIEEHLGRNRSSEKWPLWMVEPANKRGVYTRFNRGWMLLTKGPWSKWFRMGGPGRSKEEGEGGWLPDKRADRVTQSSWRTGKRTDRMTGSSWAPGKRTDRMTGSSWVPGKRSMGGGAWMAYSRKAQGDSSGLELATRAGFANKEMEERGGEGEEGGDQDKGGEEEEWRSYGTGPGAQHELKKRGNWVRVSKRETKEQKNKFEPEWWPARG